MEFSSYEEATRKRLGLEDIESGVPDFNECPKCRSEGDIVAEEWHADQNIEELYYECINEECRCHWKSITLYRALATRKIVL